MLYIHNVCCILDLHNINYSIRTFPEENMSGACHANGHLQERADIWFAHVDIWLLGCSKWLLGHG